MNPRPARGTVFDTRNTPQNTPFSAPKPPLRAYQNRTGRPGERGVYILAPCQPLGGNRSFLDSQKPVFRHSRAERTRDETGRRYPFKGPLACLLRRRARSPQPCLAGNEVAACSKRAATGMPRAAMAIPRADRTVQRAFLGTLFSDFWDSPGLHLGLGTIRVTPRGAGVGGGIFGLLYLILLRGCPIQGRVAPIPRTLCTPLITKGKVPRTPSALLPLSPHSSN
jgi:hypothetical protein